MRTSARNDNFLQAGLEEREVVTVPLVNLGLVHIDDDDAELGAVLSDDGHRDGAHIAGADAADIGDLNRCRRGHGSKFGRQHLTAHQLFS